MSLNRPIRGFPRRVTHSLDYRSLQPSCHGARDKPVWADWFKFEAYASVDTRGPRRRLSVERINGLVNYIETIQKN